MDAGLCNNFETVQDSLAFWPFSYWLCGICLFGVFMLSKKIFKSGGPLRAWLVPSLLFLLFCGFLHLIQSDRSSRMKHLERGKQVEFAGQVSNLETNYTSGGRRKFVRGGQLYSTPYSISFKVNQTDFKSKMGLLPLEAGNRCNWKSCGLENGDIVRVIRHWNGSTTKIERCTDNDG